MTISREEVDQMAVFMRALRVDDVPKPPIREFSPSSETSAAPTPTQDMKMILERFHATAGNAVARLTEDAQHDPCLREALMTERTAHGSRIGLWEIAARAEGTRYFYSVAQGDLCIASDLLLYEAAYGLVRILNNGGRLNCREAISLLRLEQDYAGALNDAVLYKHYLVKHPHDTRVRVFEARYSAAKHRAVTARDQIFDIARHY